MTPSLLDAVKSLVPRAEAVWSLADFVRRPNCPALPMDILGDMARAIEAGAIELALRPSLRPGVEAGGAGAGPKQIEFAMAFERRERNIFAASGANQSGKTITVGGLCFCRHLRDRAKDGDVYWVVAQTHETMRDVPAKTLWQFLPRSMFPGTINYNPRSGFGNIQTLQLTLPDERGKIEVWFRTEDSDLKVFESARLNGVWWTEATREAVFDALQPRLVARGGWLLMDYVPNQAWHKFRLRLNPEEVYHQTFCMADNAHNLSRGAVQRMLRTLTQDEAAVRVYGKERAAFGVVYREFDPEKHVVDPFPIPPSWPRWRAADYGYRNPSAFLWAAVSPIGWTTPWGERLSEEVLWFYRELYERERTVPQLAVMVNELSAGESYETEGVIIDPAVFAITQANGTSIGDEFRRAGLAVLPGLRTSALGEHASVSRVRRWFEAGKIRFFRTCANAIREHQSWRYKENRDGEVPGNEAFEDKNNHTCDATRYLVMANPSHEAAAGGFKVRDLEA